jgi:hypothetical protein
VLNQEGILFKKCFAQSPFDAAYPYQLCRHDAQHADRRTPHLRRARDEWQQQATTSGVRHLGASWDNFTDPQSNISGYYVQFWSQGADQPGAASGSGNGSSGSGSGVAGVDPDVLVVAPNATQLYNLSDLISVGLKNRRVGRGLCSCRLCGARGWVARGPCREL